MGPRGVAAIYFTQGANAARLPAPSAPPPTPPCQNYDSTGSPCGWLWAQGYNLNCKKIKQFLISSTGAALLRATRPLAFIFISVTSHTRRILPFFFLHTPFSGSDDLTLYAFCIVKSAWKHILFSPPATAVSSIADEMYSETEPFITVSESKAPFSKQSYRDYVWCIIWDGLMKPHEHTLSPFLNAISASVRYCGNPVAF